MLSRKLAAKNKHQTIFSNGLC